MKTLLSALLVLLLTLAFSISAKADKEEKREAILMGEAAVLTAEVIGVDRKDRTVTLKGEDGTVETIEVPEEAKNFDQVDVGDTLAIEVIRGLALALAKPGELPNDTVNRSIQVSRPGEKPKLIAVDSIDVLAEITAIDKKTREVTITGPKGNSVTIIADKEVKNFNDLKVGDKVHARYSEAVAIAIEEK